MAKQVYKNPAVAQPLISVISSGCRTPILRVRFCNLVNPFRYPNSPTIPRFSLTCIIDPEKHKEFLKGLQSIEKDENVESIIKNETKKENSVQVNTGNLLAKFQSKDKIHVFLTGNIKNPEKDAQEIELQDELAKGEEVMIVYDILRYTKKNTNPVEHGLSFKPSCIYYYPKE